MGGKQCNKHGVTSLPLSEIPIEHRSQNSHVEVDSEDAFETKNHNHDVTLKIAAKCGDRLAIHSYPLGIFTSSEFNADVQETYPLLMHRHLSSPTGWFRSELTKQEQAYHQAQAYLILEQKFGEAVAKSEYNPTTLESEIKYIKDGGELKYPRPLKDILKARAERFNDQNTDTILRNSRLPVP